MSFYRLYLVSLVIVLGGLAPSWAQTTESPPPSPIIELDVHFSQRFSEAMVVSGEPIATEVGAAILREGGNAVDAACATALTLAVTLPRAGNLGGGGFALIRDTEDRYYALDFRETAPAGAGPDWYDHPERSSVDGPTAAGIPGTVHGIKTMHERFGKLPWSRIVAPAVTAAEEGFPTSHWLHDGLTRAAERMIRYPSTEKIFYPEGRPPEVGTTFRQPELADTLKRIQREGLDGFYRGETAQRLVRAVRSGGGEWTEEDLQDYVSVWRTPVEADFNGYRVVSMPPPSSGGLHLLQMLSWLEDERYEKSEHNSAEPLHMLTESMRLAYLDRARYLGDPDYVEVPVERLLSPAYLTQKKDAIPTERAGDSRSLAPDLFSQPPHESEDTTHFNVVDADGMAVSLTYTLNFSYGSGFVAEGTGVLLNNEMDDFNVRPGEPNSYGLIGGVENRVEAGKRPLSSMTPTLISRDGQFVAAIGAPGGSRIITGVLQAVVNLLGYGFNAQTAVTLPRVHHQWYPDELFAESGIALETRQTLESKGHRVASIGAVAHVLAIVRTPEGVLEAGLDPRRPAAVGGY